MTCIHNADEILKFQWKMFLKGFQIYQSYLCALIMGTCFQWNNNFSLFFFSLDSCSTTQHALKAFSKCSLHTSPFTHQKTAAAAVKSYSTQLDKLQPSVRQYVLDKAEVCRPDDIHICDGSEAENSSLVAKLQKEGMLKPLPKYENWLVFLGCFCCPYLKKKNDVQ